MTYCPPPIRTTCRNCGKPIILDATYYRHEGGRILCDPSRTDQRAEAR